MDTVDARRKLLDKLRELASSDDPEVAHRSAELALLDYLDDPTITQAFDDVPRYY